MGVVFTSTIKIDKMDQWYIELVDTVDGRSAICYSIDEYSKQVEDFGSDYGGHIDEVKWEKDDNVPPHAMDEIRADMAKHQAEIEEKHGEPLVKN